MIQEIESLALKFHHDTHAILVETIGQPDEVYVEKMEAFTLAKPPDEMVKILRGMSRLIDILPHLLSATKGAVQVEMRSNSIYDMKIRLADYHIAKAIQEASI